MKQNLMIKSIFGLGVLIVLGVLVAFNPPADKTTPFGIAEQRTVPDSIFVRLMAAAKEAELYQKSMPEIMQFFGEQLLGTPYVAGQLDVPAEETLLAPLNGLDCVLFVEAVWALSEGAAMQDYSYQTFLNHIEKQRYRDGEMSGYCSRLHYFSEWISENEKQGRLVNITQALGGVEYPNELRFMSQHSASYRQLRENEGVTECIAEMELALDKNGVWYISQDQIRAAYDKMQTGDIIAFTTSVEGLDIAHTALVYRYQNGHVGFMHASSAGQVMLTDDIQDYVQDKKTQSGIMIARTIDPRETQSN